MALHPRTKLHPLPLLLALLSIAQFSSLSSSLPASSVSVDFMPDTSTGFRTWDNPAGGGTGGNFGYRSNYDRSEEVQQQCESYLKDLATDPSFGREAENKRWSILNELTFLNGEWEEASSKGRRPLMPFMEQHSFFANREQPDETPAMGYNSTGIPVDKEPVHVVSNWITDVQLFNGVPLSSKGNMVNVSVVLQVGISSERSLSYMGSGLQGFQVYPGFSLLGILMEGVYAELKNGERLLCLLGSTKLPSRGKNESDPWDWLGSAWNKGRFSPPLSDDSKILAVLHFPKELSLTSRAVVGRLQSLNAPTNPNYFDPIDLSSQLGAYANYQFKSGDLVSSACDSPRQPGELASPKNVYQGTSFCTVVQEILTGQWVDFLPNWNCTLSNTTCMKLGPFQSSPQQAMVDGGFNGTQLLVQDIRCVDYPEKDGSLSANISAVFRAVLPSENQNLAFEQTSLDGLTLAAEGKWNSKSGELCMVGCRGGMTLSSKTSAKEACNTKIHIYIPLTLSLRQRSILEGSISSAGASSDDFYPLSFHLPLYPLQLPFDLAQNMTYEYTRINEAGALLEQDEPVGFGESIKKSLLEYPSANHSGDFMVLFEDLSLQTLAITNPDSSKGPHLKHFVELNMVAIEDRVKLHWMQARDAAAPESATDDEVEKVDEQKSFYKVATQLKIKDNLGNKVMAVAAEGEYDPTVGRSYLLGCREVNAPWKTFQENAELLEEGLDCMIVLKVEYPPTNARWFMNPTVMLTVTSRRTVDDPLFFPKINLETFPILYKRQREEIVSRKSLEGGLSILTLSLILGCIVSQLMYVKTHADSTPYISLLMLAVQAVGFSIPLITGMEAFFARMRSDSDDIKETVLSEGRWSHVIGYIVNLLTLATFLLTLRIVQKVYKSRIRLLSRRPLESWRVPSDKKVLGICSGVHALGFITVLIIHSIRMSKRPISSSTYMDWYGGLHKQYDWEKILKEYYGLVQDLFLLPQVVGNHLWVVKGKPLRMLFYVGVTVLRLLPHVYDSLRSPVFNPYFADEFQYANPSSDFYSKAGDIAIPVFAVLLAIVIYIQQRWNGLKWGKVLRQGSSKLMRMGSKMYERLPSKTFEAEMVESVTATQDDLEHENGHLTGNGGVP